MKKLFTMILIFTMLFTISGCQNKVEPEVSTETEAETSIETEETSQVETEESTEETETETEKEVDPIVGKWSVDTFKVYDITYTKDDMKEVLDEEDYNSILLTFEFKEDGTVTSYQNGEEQETVDWEEIEENTYTCTDGTVFVLEDEKLYVTQDDVYIFFVKE